MASEWIAQFAQQNGLQVSVVGSAYGKIKGYFVSVAEQNAFIVAGITYYADTVDKMKVDRLSDALRADQQIRMLQGSASATNSGISIRLINGEQSRSVISAKLLQYIDFVASLGLSAENKPKPAPAEAAATQPGATGVNRPVAPGYAPTSGNQPFVGAGRPVNFNTGSQPGYTQSNGYTQPGNYTQPGYNYSQNIPYSGQNTGYAGTGATGYGGVRNANRKVTVSNTGFTGVWMGIIGALLGALIGGILWIICFGVKAGYISLYVLSAVLCAFASSFGYKKLGGLDNNVARMVIITLSVVLVLVSSEFIVYGLRLSYEFDVSFFNAFKLLSIGSDMSGKIKTNIILNALIAVAAGVFGSVMAAKNNS